jgi:acyl carrier protein
MPPTRAALVEWMLQYIVMSMELPREGVLPEGRFSSYGLDSLELVVMAGLMEDEFGLQLNDMNLFDKRSIEGVADALEQAGLLQAT